MTYCAFWLSLWFPYGPRDGMARMHDFELETVQRIKALGQKTLSTSRRSLQTAVDFARAEAEAEAASALARAGGPCI